MTSFHHQPEAQHPKSSAIHKPPADYPIFANDPNGCSTGIAHDNETDMRHTQKYRTLKDRSIAFHGNESLACRW